MIEIPLPTLQERKLNLRSLDAVRSEDFPSAPRDRDSPPLGERPPPSRERVPSLSGRISLGGPLAVQVTPDYVADDPGLRAFVEQEYEHVTYHVVHLSISFAAKPRTPRLSTADVKLALSSASASVEPVAWSMTPQQVTDVAQVERRFTLGPQLSLLGADVSLGEIGRTTSRQRTDVFLQARNELRSDPEWTFTSTKTMSLSGSYRLVLIVRGARESATGIDVTINAATEGNLLRWYGRTLPDPLRLAAVL